MRHGARPIFFLAMLGCLALLRTSQAMATQFWLAGRDPVDRVAKHLDNPADYMDLFSPGAPWQQAASRLGVFKVPAQFVLSGSDDMVRTVFNDMHRRHVAMALESATLVRSPECGFGEGMARPELLDRVGTRLQSLGLTLEYLAMDEPVWHGHEKTWGQNDCGYPMTVVAQRVAQGVRQMRRYFPNIRVGDIDVVTDRIDPARLAADYAAFAQLFAQDTGTPLAFFHADTAWRRSWQEPLTAVGAAMHRLHVPFGIIIGGSADAGNDAEAGEEAMQRLRWAASNAATHPEDVVVQSWVLLPDRMLPETVPGSATNTLLRAEQFLP